MGEADAAEQAKTIRKVLMVDDLEPLLRSMARSFARLGIELVAAQTSETAVSLAQHERPEIILIDLFLTPPDNGLRLLAELKAVCPDAFCILMSAHMSVAHAVLAVKSGADDVFLKPFTASQVVQRVVGGASTPNMDTPTLQQIEWEHIARVLGDYDGNITHAAEALGVFRQSLQRKIARHAPRVLHEDELPTATRKPRRRSPT